MICPACFYDLIGLPDGVCPECGHPSNAAQRATAALQRRFISDRRRDVVGIRVLAGLLVLGTICFVVPPFVIGAYFLVGHVWSNNQPALQRSAFATAWTLSWPLHALIWIVPLAVTIAAIGVVSSAQPAAAWEALIMVVAFVFTLVVTSWLVLRHWWKRWDAWSCGVLATPVELVGTGADLTLRRTRLRLMLWSLMSPFGVPVVLLVVTHVAHAI